MYTSVTSDSEFDRDILNRLGRSWNARTAVRQDRLDLTQYYDPSIPDFPTVLVPFWSDPEFSERDDDFKGRLLAAAWVAFNERVIFVEEQVVQPACRPLLVGRLPGVGHPSVKQVIAQVQVDEQFHTLMSLDICNVARARRRIEDYVVPEPSFAAHRENLVAAAIDEQDAALAKLAYASVTEMTIGPTFEQVKSDTTIQPINRANTEMHWRDESTHHIAFSEFVGLIYPKLNADKQARFCGYIRSVLDEFTFFDRSFWAGILNYMDVPGRDSILKELERSAGDHRATRNTETLENALSELGIKEKVQIPFD